MAFALPRTLTAGERENAAHIQENDQAIVAALNSMAEQWVPVAEFTTELDGTTTGTAQVISTHGSTSGADTLNGTVGFAILMIDSTNISIADYTTQLRIKATMVGGNPPQASDNIAIQFALVGCNVNAGLTELDPSGSDVGLLVFPGILTANAEVSEVSAPFSLPANGVYALTTEMTSGSLPGTGVVGLRVELQMRHV